MSKKNNRRLSVKRETLRQLDQTELNEVAGGDKARTAYCAATYTCTWNGGNTGLCLSHDCVGS